MLTWVVAVPPEVSEKTPFVELELRLIVSGTLVGLLKASSSVTVIRPRVAVLEAVPETAVDVKTNFAGGAVVTVTEAVGVAATLEFESTALIP